GTAFLTQVNHDRAGFEEDDRAAIRSVGINQYRHFAVLVEPAKIRHVLFAGKDVHRPHLIRQVDFLQHEDHLHDIGTAHPEELDGPVHEVIGHGGVDVDHSNCLSSLPISDGLRVTVKPHSFMIASLASAVSAPPEISAPAWPMRLPAGAVTPAMKPTIGFFMLSLHQRAASASSGPPISPIMITASVFGSSLNMRIASMCLRPLIGSPPIPTADDWPRPISVSCPTASYVSVPERDTTPMRPLR